ncbi:MAG TPA: 2-dehydropantoate 2-reductase N-terminal domain-containing protein, partial [Acidimicrobiia bacterium]
VDHVSAVTFRPDDVVLVATKSQQTADALAELTDAAPPDTAVICAQNGVENERLALRRFSNVYGVCVMCPASHLEPGVVRAHRAPVPGILDLGRYPSGVDATAAELAAELTSAGFLSDPKADIMRWKYKKLLLNLGNAIEAICGPETRGGALYERAHREGVACLDAAGIAYVTDADDAARRGDLIPRPPGGEPRGGSSWQSMTRQTGNIEADYLNGEIVLLGRLHGVPTPVNAVLQRLANQLASARTAPGSMTADDILALIS